MAQHVQNDNSVTGGNNPRFWPYTLGPAVALTSFLLLPATSVAQDVPDAVQRPPTVMITFSATVDELRFDSGPDLRVGTPERPPAPIAADTCRFQAGTTYRNLRVELTVSDRSATLTCASAPAGPTAEAEPADPVAEPENTDLAAYVPPQED